MLNKNALIDKFGNWASVYADAVATTLRLYSAQDTQISLRKTIGEYEDVVLMIKCKQAEGTEYCLIDTIEINRLRAECPAFKTQCTEVVANTKQGKIEYTYVDPSTLKPGDIERRHFSYTWEPDPAIVELVHSTIGVPEKRMSVLCHNARLQESDSRRVARISSLYMLSSSVLPSYHIYIQNEGYTLVFAGTHVLSLSWCMHVIRQVELQVDRIRIFKTEVHFQFKIPLKRCDELAVSKGQSIEDGGPMRTHRATRGRPSSILSRLGSLLGVVKNQSS